jgi:hypothetical protein
MACFIPYLCHLVLVALDVEISLQISAALMLAFTRAAPSFCCAFPNKTDFLKNHFFYSLIQMYLLDFEFDYSNFEQAKNLSFFLKFFHLK